MSRAFFKILLGLVIFSSCRTMVTYEVNNPPEIDLPQQQHNVVIINRHDTSALDINQEKKLALYKEAFAVFYQRFKQELLNDPRFIIIGEEYMPKSSMTGHQVPEIERERLNKTYFSDLFFIVDDFSIERIQAMNVQEDMGYRSRIAYFGVEMATRIFLIDKKWQVMDDHRVELEQLIDYREVISGLLAIGPSLANQEDIVLPLAKDVAKTYFDRFYPSPQFVTKGIYAGKHFEGLEYMLQYKRFDQATEFLLPLTRHKNFKVADRAIYNLAIVKEAEGKKEEAEQLMQLYRKRQRTY